MAYLEVTAVYVRCVNHILSGVVLYVMRQRVTNNNNDNIGVF